MLRINFKQKHLAYRTLKDAIFNTFSPFQPLPPTKFHFQPAAILASKYILYRLIILSTLQDPISPISYKQRPAASPPGGGGGGGGGDGGARNGPENAQHTNGHAANGTEERWRQNYVPTPYDTYKVMCPSAMYTWRQNRHTCLYAYVHLRQAGHIAILLLNAIKYYIGLCWICIASIASASKNIIWWNRAG